MEVCVEATDSISCVCAKTASLASSARFVSQFILSNKLVLLFIVGSHSKTDCYNHVLNKEYKN